MVRRRQPDVSVDVRLESLTYVTGVTIAARRSECRCHGGGNGFYSACSYWRCFTRASQCKLPPRSSSTKISSTALCQSSLRPLSTRLTSIEARFIRFGSIAIDPRTRRFLIACQIEGEFHPPVTGPISERVGRSPQTPEGWRKFRFDVKALVNIEPGLDGAPRFRIEIDEVKKRELDGFSGVVARFLGQYFDELVTQLASGRASRLNNRLNDEIKKRVTLFKEYGVFRAIDYSPTEVVLHFDVTRFRSEGIAGYVFAAEQPGTVPLYRWFHPRDGSHYYTIRPNAPDRPNSVSDGVSCYVYDHPVAETVPMFHWRKPARRFLHDLADGENAGSGRLPAAGHRRLSLSRPQARDRAALPLL